MICAFIEYNGRDDSQTLGSLPFMDFEINGQCSKKKNTLFEFMYPVILNYIMPEVKSGLHRLLHPMDAS